MECNGRSKKKETGCSQRLRENVAEDSQDGYRAKDGRIFIYSNQLFNSSITNC